MRSLTSIAVLAAFALSAPAGDPPTPKAVAVAMALAGAPAEPPPTARAVAVALALAGPAPLESEAVECDGLVCRPVPATVKQPAGPERFAVRLVVSTARGIVSGSGTVVKSPAGPVVLTAKHVVESATAVTVLTPDGRWFAAAVVAADPSADLAAVSCPAGLPAAEVGEYTTAGAGVRVFGHTLGHPVARLKSAVVAGAAELAGRPLLRSGIDSQPGDSGGAVFAADGAVVGVVVLTGGMAETAATVRKFLATLTAPTPMPAAKAAAPTPAPKLTLTRVTADWCVPCRRLKVSLADPAVLTELARFDVKVADVTRDPATAQSLAPNGIPALIVTDAAGTEVGRTAGYLAPAELAAWLGRFGK